MPDSVLDIVWQNMERELKDLCVRGGGEAGVRSAGSMGYSVLDLKTGRRAGFRDDMVSPTASTIKIAILLGVATKVETGALSWEQRVKVPAGGKVGGGGPLGYFRHEADLSLWDVAGLMIDHSDNDATNICIDLAGMEFVNGLVAGLGLTQTHLRRHMMDWEAVKRGEENVSTPGELVNLLDKIYRRDGIAAGAGKSALELLELPKVSPFTVALPASVRRANKPGGLDHVSVDAGIIYLPGRDFCLAVMGSFLDGKAETLVAEVVAAAYRYMAVLAECTDLGRG